MGLGWRTPDGLLLVEGEPSPVTILGNHYPIQGEDGRPLPDAHTYHLLDPASTVVVVYDTQFGSYEHDLYGRAHRVVGDTLWEFATIYHNVGSNLPPESATSTRSMQQGGLARMPAGEVPSAGAVRAALARHEEQLRANPHPLDRKVTEVRAALRAVVAALPADRPIDLLLEYDQTTILRYAGGPAIWRDDIGWPYRVKDLHWLLRDLLTAHLGENLSSLDVDVPDEAWDAYG